MSVPGIAIAMLFRASARVQATFALYGENGSDLYKTVKTNIVGGPSIIYNCYAKSGGCDLHSKQPRKPVPELEGNSKQTCICLLPPHGNQC